MYGRRIGMAGSVVLLAACTDLPPTPVGKPSMRVVEMAHAEVAAAAQGRKARGFEDELLRMESRIPGFGGMFRDSDGSVVAYLTDMNRAGIARAEIARSANRFDVDESTAGKLRSGAVEFRAGRFAFSELVAMQAKVAEAVAELVGVAWIDADEKTNRVRLAIDPAADRGVFREANAAANIPPDAVEIVSGKPGEFSNIRSHFLNGIAGGLQIHNGAGSCTLGFIGSLSSGEYGFLTAAHCAAGELGAGTTGGAIYQNGVPAGQVGSVLLNPAWNLTDPRCLGNVKCAWTDGMFVQKVGTRPFYHYVAHTDSAGHNSHIGSIMERPDWFNPVGRTISFTGMEIDKVGRTTGWTVGTLEITCAVHQVGIGGGQYATMLCLDKVDNSAIGRGDSGGPVFKRGANGTLPIWGVGLVSAFDDATVLNRTSWPAIPTDEWCDVNCDYWYSDLWAVEYHLSRTFYP